MSIVRCGNGHYYDSEKYSGCPYCPSAEGTAGHGAADRYDAGATGCAGADYDPMQDAPTSAFAVGGSEDVTVGYADGSPFGADRCGEDERTVGYVESRIDMDPVVGWLVCTDGEERGRDYRLHSGRNFVGRAAAMDVIICDDGEVSRENHCSLVYDPLHGEYLLAPGHGTLTYKGGEPVRETVPLRDGDEIGIGDSTFVFVAFCKDGRRWV